MDISSLHPVLLALIAGLFTWGMTAAGAALVFLAADFSRRALDTMLGFAAGVMIAASFWSLLVPAIGLCGNWGRWAFVPPAIGFLLGAVFLRLIDFVLPHVHIGSRTPEGMTTGWRRTTLLVLAITLHNIPEGLSFGVAFGAAQGGFSGASLAGAIVLALGIGIQNFPEGAAVSIPLRREGLSARKAFFYGQISGFVEPVAAVIGALAVGVARPLLPYALAFAAGAMIFVVVEEVIPESQSGGNSDWATMGAIVGFIVMMSLDVSLS